MWAFLVWFILCILVAMFANKKGRSGIVYFLLSIVISPLIGFIVVLILGDANKIKCSNCGEKIDEKANVCPFCGDVKKELNKKDSSSEIKKISSTTAIVTIEKENSKYTFEKIKEIIVNTYDKKYRAEVTKDTPTLFFIHSTAAEHGQNYIQVQNKADTFIIECFNIDIPKEFEMKEKKLHENTEQSIDKLIELSKMLEKGLITKEEFEIHKSKLV